MMVKLAKMDKPLVAILLLLSASSQMTLHQSSTNMLPNPSPTFSSTSFPSPQLPKFEIPMFSSENMLGWIFQIEHFFAYHQTPSDQKLVVEAFYMTGATL